MPCALLSLKTPGVTDTALEDTGEPSGQSGSSSPRYMRSLSSRLSAAALELTERLIGHRLKAMRGLLIPLGWSVGLILAVIGAVTGSKAFDRTFHLLGDYSSGPRTYPGPDPRPRRKSDETR